MNNIRYFKYHSDYVSEESGLTNPNVSYCANQADVHYKVKDYRDEYLTFEALENGTFSLDIGSAVSTSVLSSISYSIDSGETWVTTNNVNSQAVTITTPTVTAGNTVMWKGSGTGVSTTINNNDRPSTSSIFSSTGTFNAKGNILSLIYGDSYNTTKTAKIVSCEKMVMPIKSIPNFCYLRVFQGCTTLETPMRIIDAESGGENCCFSMFYACSAMKECPKLPATQLSSQSYRSMFSNCSNIVKAPELPCKSVPVSGYMQTFYNCTSLTVAPELPATALSSYCYSQMFYGCSNLTVAPKLSVTTLAYGCYHYMFYNCTSLMVAPELPSTALAEYCYASMFYGCSKLTVAPVLPATTLSTSCYDNMFRLCTNLTIPPKIYATDSSNGEYSCRSMFHSCYSLIEAPELRITSVGVMCYSYMFNYCRSLINVPELPATELANGCYYYMFYGCPKITKSPVLPAETLVENCYQYMFGTCSKVSEVTCLATDISASGCVDNWLSGVAASGTFVKNSTAQWDVTGVNGIPNGWTVQTASS